jgi:hypothetical protein
MSDGRVAIYELIDRRRQAVVSCELPEGGVILGALQLHDKQCVFTWDQENDPELSQVRLYAENFLVGGIVALRPGHGPAKLFEVVACTFLPVGSSCRPGGRM